MDNSSVIRRKVNMKKFRTKLVMVLAVVMILTSFEVASVFAEPAPPEAAPAVSVFGGKDSVHLEWTPVDGVKYAVFKGSKAEGTPLIEDATGGKYRVTGLAAGSSGSVTVVAYTSTYSDPESKATTVNYGGATGPVRTISYNLKIKKSGTLKSHHGPKATYKVKKGQTVSAFGYGGGGKYMFKNGSSIFYVAKIRVGKKKAVYTKAFDYSAKTAECFVNDAGLSSKTPYLVWVNTYTQRMYVFAGSKGNWKCVNGGVECATGKASSPTPTGPYGNKQIIKKIKTRHGIKWWSPFSGINSIHGKKSSWKMGKPASNGCVRNMPNNAKFVYDNCKKGTKVYIY
jgi:lipoprotein-anchoring transpeptidase ErfK/SrfK